MPYRVGSEVKLRVESIERHSERHDLIAGSCAEIGLGPVEWAWRLS